MFGKKKKPAWKLQLGVDMKRCAECGKHERPCLADEKPATFHRWVDESGLLCCTTLALVEYPDGSVGMVKPELIQFLDRREE